MKFPSNFSEDNGNTRLRLLCEEDRDLFIRLSACKVTMKYVAEPLSEQQASEKFEHRLASTQSIANGEMLFSDSPENTWFVFSIIDISSGKSIGSIGIRKLQVHDNNQADRKLTTAEIGFVLAPENCGLGHGSRALTMAKNVLSMLGVGQLVAICAAVNEGSVALLNSAGFAEVQGFKEITTIGGNAFDDVKFSALLV